MAKPGDFARRRQLDAFHDRLRGGGVKGTWALEHLDDLVKTPAFVSSPRDLAINRIATMWPGGEEAEDDLVDATRFALHTLKPWPEPPMLS